jgi:TPR repeat protein
MLPPARAALATGWLLYTAACGGAPARTAPAATGGATTVRLTAEPRVTDPTAGLEQEERCAAGDAFDCSMIALDAEESRDRERAYRYYLRACELDDGSSCAEVADRVDDDLEELVYREKACALHDAAACKRLGDDQERDGMRERAKEYLGLACQLGSGSACDDYAELVEPADDER